MTRLNALWPPHAFRFKTALQWVDPIGGTIVKDLTKSSNPAAAIDSLPVPTPAPPVAADAAEVIAAEQDYARQNLLKKSVKKTITPGGGDTGGFTLGEAGYPGMPQGGVSSYKKLG